MSKRLFKKILFNLKHEAKPGIQNQTKPKLFLSDIIFS